MKKYKYYIMNFDMVYDNSGNCIDITNIRKKAYYSHCQTDDVFICNKVKA
jgi:hypothetical protein